MDSAQRVTQTFSYSQYCLELTGDTKNQYLDKLKLICCKRDPYCCLEKPSSFSGNAIEWHEWPDMMYADVYNYLILTPSLYTHEQLKSYKSLEAFNQVVNGWVSDIVCTVTRSSSSKLYLFTALVKHSQSLSLPSLKVWVSVKQSGEVLCAHCTCMAGAGEVCSHIASVLFTLDLNTQMKQQFSCTSLPCSWLPSTFRSVPFSEISKIDFTTPKHKHKQAVTEGSGESSTKSKSFLFLSLPILI